MSRQFVAEKLLNWVTKRSHHYLHILPISTSLPISSYLSIFSLSPLSSPPPPSSPIPPSFPSPHFPISSSLRYYINLPPPLPHNHCLHVLHQPLPSPSLPHNHFLHILQDKRLPIVIDNTRYICSEILPRLVDLLRKHNYPHLDLIIKVCCSVNASQNV